MFTAGPLVFDSISIESDPADLDLVEDSDPIAGFGLTTDAFDCTAVDAVFVAYTTVVESPNLHRKDDAVADADADADADTNAIDRSDLDFADSDPATRGAGTPPREDSNNNEEPELSWWRFR